MKKLVAALLLYLPLSINAHDFTALPLGDGKLSNAPKIGWVWPCRVEPNAGGAWRDGPWINKSNGTYNLTAKTTVPGTVTWPSSFNIRLRQDKRIFTSNDLPSHPTGIFPIPHNSAAYQYDTNPNIISPQDILLTLPANPTLAAEPSCAPGAVGLLLSGVALFNALDAPGRDAVAHETQDSCQGHPQMAGAYHYHSVSSCVDTKSDSNGHSALVGYMIDGFGIYGHYGEGGKLLSSQDLDECHGHTHTIIWDGKKRSMYHYHATWDFPYTAGCIRGKYQLSDVLKLSGNQHPHNRQTPDISEHHDARPPVDHNGRPPHNQSEGRRHPDLNKAARLLGVSQQKLREALGPPPPDLDSAARRLNISVEQLRTALDAARD
jgi:hypothetical protein